MTTLAEKRASLHASLEQHIGQVNRHNGAIAILDELIAEEAERASAMERAGIHDFQGNPLTMEQMDASEDAPPPPFYSPIDRASSPYWNNNVNAPEDAIPPVWEPAPPPAPEMLPVVRGTGDGTEETLDARMWPDALVHRLCDGCMFPDTCSRTGCRR